MMAGNIKGTARIMNNIPPTEELLALFAPVSKAEMKMNMLNNNKANKQKLSKIISLTKNGAE